MLDSLISNPDTTEATVHRALATNLWIFGPEFALMASNQTVARVVEQYTKEKFEGERAAKRPDLLLLSQIGRRYTLLEFKRPSHKIGRSDINQAEAYRDDLASKFSLMEVRVIGGDHDRRMDLNPPANVQIVSYAGLIGRARNELTWLLSELASKDVASSP